MGLVGWLIVLSLPAYAAVQLWAIAVLARRMERDERPAPPDPVGYGLYEDDGAEPSRPAGGPIRCGRCGAANDPGFRYCRRCVTRLPARASG